MTGTSSQEARQLTNEERRFQLYRDRVRANENLCRYQLKRKLEYDKQHPALELKVGDKVLHRKYSRRPGTAAKFNVKWTGPFEVYSQVSPLTYMLRKVGDIQEDDVFMAHIHNLKLYNDPIELPQESSESTDYDGSLLDYIQFNVQRNVNEQDANPEMIVPDRPEGWITPEQRSSTSSSSSSSDSTLRNQLQEGEQVEPIQVDEMSDSSESTVQENRRQEMPGPSGAQSRPEVNPDASKAAEADIESNSESSSEDSSKISSKKAKSKKSLSVSVSTRKSGRTVKPVERLNIDKSNTKSYKKLELLARIFEAVMT